MEWLVAVVECRMKAEHGFVSDALDQEGVIVPGDGRGVAGEELLSVLIRVESEMPIRDELFDCFLDLSMAGLGNGDGRHGELTVFALLPGLLAWKSNRRVEGNVDMRSCSCSYSSHSRSRH